MSYDWKQHASDPPKDGSANNEPAIPWGWADLPVFQTLAAAEAAHSAGNLEDEDGALAHAVELAGRDFLGNRRKLFYERVEWLKREGRLRSTPEGVSAVPVSFGAFRKSRIKPFWLVVAGVGALLVFGGGGVKLGGLFDSSPADHSDRVASLIGASSCSSTGYYVQNRLDGSKSTIYSCDLDSGVKCVTESGGIASDSTEEVKLLFESTLSGDKPTCVDGY